MNILPKKKWHVRTKDNIARVRRDEANAAKEEKEVQRRAQLAEQEARTYYLRKKASDRLAPSSISESPEVPSQVALITSAGSHLEHVSFISESEKEQKKWGANKEREEEIKQEKEKYEKGIGLLTYLGQSVLDTKGEQPWYATKRKSDDNLTQDGKDEVKSKSKNLLDPLNDMKKYLKMIEPLGGPADKIMKRLPVTTARSTLPTTVASASVVPSLSKRKHSKNKKSHKSKKKKNLKTSRKRKRSSSSSESGSDMSEDRKDVIVKEQKMTTMERLRVERLQRERQERIKAEKLLAKLKGESSGEVVRTQSPPHDGRQKYNSQFNPHLAKKPRLEL